MRRHERLIVVLALLVSLATGCDNAPADGPRVVVADSAGIVIVRNLAPDEPLGLLSEPVRALGGKDTPEESFYRVNDYVAGADGRGNLYVLDGDNFAVQVFDSIGRHLRTLGRQGGGPGELQYPLTLSVSEDGLVRVADIAKRSFVQWGADGGVIPTEPFPTFFGGGAVRWTPTGLVLSLQNAEGQRVVVVEASGEETEIAAVSEETRSIRLESCGMSFSGIPPLFSPVLTWTAAGNTVVVARNPEYAIDFYEDGQLVRSIRRDVPTQPASAELAAALLGVGMRVGTPGGERVCDPEEVVRVRGFAPWLPMFEGLALASDGTLWVQRYTVDDGPGPIDIFDPDGRYAGTMPEGSAFPIGFLPHGDILTSERDDLDIERLVVRRLIDVGDAEAAPPY